MYKDKLDLIDTILILKDGMYKYQETIVEKLADIDGPSRRVECWRQEHSCVEAQKAHLSLVA